MPRTFEDRADERDLARSEAGAPRITPSNVMTYWNTIEGDDECLQCFKRCDGEFCSDECLKLYQEM